MPRRRRFRAAEAALAVLLLALCTACGSRLPESDFAHRERPTSAQDTTPIRVGIVTSATSPVGGSAFTGPRDGAKAYFDHSTRAGASKTAGSRCASATTAAAGPATTRVCTG